MNGKSKIYNTFVFNIKIALLFTGVFFFNNIYSSTTIKNEDNLVELNSHALYYLSSAMDNIYKANASLIKISFGVLFIKALQKHRYQKLNFGVFNNENKLIKKIGNNPDCSKLKKLQDLLLKFQINISNGGAQSEWFKRSYLLEALTAALVAKTAADNYLLGAQYEAEKEKKIVGNLDQNIQGINKNEIFDKNMFNNLINLDKVSGFLSKWKLSSLGERVQKCQNGIKSEGEILSDQETGIIITPSEKAFLCVLQMQKNQSNRSITGAVIDFALWSPLVALMGNVGADVHYALKNLEKTDCINEAVSNGDYSQKFGVRKCPCSGHSYGPDTCMCKCDEKKDIKDMTVDDLIAKAHGAFLAYSVHSSNLSCSEG